MITITTVGYGDFGLSEAGQQFTSLLLVGGIGVASYGIATLVEAVMGLEFGRSRQMQATIDGLTEHAVVCGYGPMGRAVSSQLGGDVVVITDAPAELELAQEDDHLVVAAGPTEDAGLLRAGLERAAHLVATASDARDNIVVTLTARELAPHLIIMARASREGDVAKLRRAGADCVVCPHESFGSDIAQAIFHPRIAEFLASSKHGGALALAEIEVAAGSHRDGVCLRDYGQSAGDRLSFVGLDRPGQVLVMPPPGATVLQGADVLIVAGDPQQIVEMSELAGTPRKASSWAG